MLRKMPGDEWQKFANLRLLYGFMFGHPGKKLLFMGDEFGQWSEWNHEASLEWHLLKNPLHAGLQRWVRDLNTLYRGQPSLHELDFESRGLRVGRLQGLAAKRHQLSPPRTKCRMTKCFSCVISRRSCERIIAWAFPLEGYWKEILNSDAPLYGGSGQGNFGGLSTIPLPIHGRPFTLNMTLPPLGVVAFQPDSHSCRMKRAKKAHHGKTTGQRSGSSLVPERNYL